MNVKRDHVEMERRRKRAAKMFEKGIPTSEIARRLGVTRQAAYAWKSDWEAGGVEALNSKGSAGPKSRISVEQSQEIYDALLEGPLARGYRTDLWTLPRVTLLIKDLTRVQYHPGHVWKLLGALGLSCQRPTRRALERDEAAIRHWRRVKWPAIKKKPGAKEESSSTSTKLVQALARLG